MEILKFLDLFSIPRKEQNFFISPAYFIIINMTICVYQSMLKFALNLLHAFMSVSAIINE